MDRTNQITSYISKGIRAWIQLNRSPALYDVIVKNNSKDDEKSLTVLNGKRSDNLKYWKHSFFVYVSMLLLIICYLYVLKLYLFKILNIQLF